MATKQPTKPTTTQAAPVSQALIDAAVTNLHLLEMQLAATQRLLATLRAAVEASRAG